MTRQAIEPGAGLGLPFSSAIVANGLVFVAGRVGRGDGGKPLDGIEAQTRKVMEDISAVLQRAGSSMDKVVRTTIFLTDRADFRAMNAVYATFFPEDPPARSTVEVSNLMTDGYLLEIDAIATL